MDGDSSNDHNPTTPALEVRNITKRFPGVLANDRISFALRPGEIHALLGENGAGKSTLMNIIYGLYQQDEGEILVNGAAVEIRSPDDAIRIGIGMVHQHFMLIPTLTVAENIVLGNEMTKGGLLDRQRASEQIRKLSKQYGLEIDPDAYVRDISVGHQQRVEIVKALYRGADILILDEPTAVLTPQEADDLFLVIRSLAEQGKSIIFISHKLQEVLDLADRITVLRNGQVVGMIDAAEATKELCASMMVGRTVELVVDKGPAEPKEPVLSVQDLYVRDDRGLPVVNNVSLEVRAGEILGIAGVQGNGQTELVEAIVGLREVYDGDVTILGKAANDLTPRRVTELGVAHIPEDRQTDGLVGTYSIADNLVLNNYYLAPFSRGISRDEKAVREQAERLVEKFDVRTPNIDTSVSSLSGGNQQKVIVAREFSRPVRLIVASQPTRGIDVGSIEFIHRQLVQLRDEGAAVLLVSAELDEILALSDRIAVMYRGKILDTFQAEQTTRDQLGLLMAGVRREEEREHKIHAPVSTEE